MSNTIYLPSDESSRVKIQIADGEPIEVSVLDIDMILDRAIVKGRDNGSDWRDEFKDLLRLELNVKLSRDQAYWLYVANRERIESIKKKLSKG